MFPSYRLLGVVQTIKKRMVRSGGGGREAEQASLRRRQLGTWRWENAGLYRTRDTKHSIILSDEYHCCAPFPDEETGAKEIKMLPCKLKIGGSLERYLSG